MTLLSYLNAAMTKSREPQVEDLLKVAAEVLEGTRDRADLDAHGISIGEPIAGDETKAMLLEELKQAEEVESVAAALWAEMIMQGAQEGNTARLEALFASEDERAAASLAASISRDFASDGWEVRVAKSSAPSEELRVTVLTRPVVLGPEVLQVLLGQMTDTAGEFSCAFHGLRLAPPKKRPWWRFW